MNLDLEKLTTNKAIGITCDSNTDMLKFNVSKKVVPETKKYNFRCSKFHFRPNGSYSSSNHENKTINSKFMEKRVKLE